MDSRIAHLIYKCYAESKSIAFSKTKKENDIQFEIKRNYFDPNKDSPPSIWKSRLMERIEMHNVSKSNNVTIIKY
jgi:hypothetical protein